MNSMNRYLTPVTHFYASNDSLTSLEEEVDHDESLHKLELSPEKKVSDTVPPAPVSFYCIKQNNRTPVTLHFTDDETESETEDNNSSAPPSCFYINNMNESSEYMDPVQSTNPIIDDNNVPTATSNVNSVMIETKTETGYRKRSSLGRISEKISNETVWLRTKIHNKNIEIKDRKKAKEGRKLAKKQKQKADKLIRKKDKDCNGKRTNNDQ